MRSRRPQTSLNADEIGALLRAPNRRYRTGCRDYALMSLFVACGLRCAEALDLELRDVNLTTAEVFVRHGKGGSPRSVWLDDGALEALREWRRRRPDLGMYVFCTRTGKRLNDRWVRRMVKRYAVEAGILKDVHPHTLRHTFGTVLARSGAPIRAVQTALGHRNLNTTMQYTHVSDDDVRQMMRGKK